MPRLQLLLYFSLMTLALGVSFGSTPAAATTTLCKTTESSCSGANMYPVGTEINGQLLNFTKAVFTPAGELPTIECSGSELRSEVETTTTPSGENEVLSFHFCNQTVEVLGPFGAGRFGIHQDAEHNGTLTLSGLEIRIKAFFGSLSCDFGGTLSSGVTLTGGAPAVVDVTATVPLIGQTGFIECPNSTVWHAEYRINTPNTLYVSSGV